MAAKEIREARAKVRERERAIWNDVEAAGRDARAADAARAARRAMNDTMVRYWSKYKPSRLDTLKE